MTAWSPVRRAPHACPHRRLRRLLARALPHGIALGVSTLRPWASASFVGARHLFACSPGAGDTASLRQALQAQLDGAEFRLPGHVVADIAVEAAAGDLQIEILTVED